MRRLIVFVVILLLLLGIASTFQVYGPQLLHIPSVSLPQINQPVKIVSEESVTIDIVKKVGPSVVTVVEQLPPQSQTPSMDFGPFGFFNIPGGGTSDQSEPQAIGSGFIINSSGLVVTNKHVVADTSGKYQVITADNKRYDVQKIYRDSANDVAVIKIDPSQNAGTTLKPVTLGDSSNLQVGQFAIAIGTALGEFRNTVTTGVISGLGRGITAGDALQGETENLNNVIQTSAAINPGNSGGPLLNSSGLVIGVNTAVASSGQNIGFALPVNLIKDSLSTFNQTGFERPYLGIGYKAISQAVALMNDVPEGAYVQQVVSGSPADQAGIQVGDIIVKIDGERLTDQDGSLASIIVKKKVGQTITITYWRNSKTQDTKATLTSAANQ